MAMFAQLVKEALRRPVALWVVVMMLVISLVISPNEQQFVGLSRSFLVGQTNFLNTPVNMTDVAVVGEKMYWPQGVLPAIVMIPLVFVFDRFGITANQSIVQMPMVFVIGYLVYMMARKKGWSKEDSWFWAETFLVSSVFLGVMLLPWSWYFAHVVATMFWFLILCEYMSHRRFDVLGVLVGCLFLTRITAGFGAILFVGLALFNTIGLTKFLKMIVPIIVAIVINGIYNYLRFGDVFEYGFKYAFFSEVVRNRLSLGVISLHHLWPNIYHSLLAGPIIFYKPPYLAVDSWGMSMFLTSPWLFNLFRIKKWLFESVLALIVALITFFGICLYFSLGWKGFGYRYSLDFLPLLFFILVQSLMPKKIGLIFRRIVVVSMVFNFFLFLLFINQMR